MSHLESRKIRLRSESHECATTICCRLLAVLCRSPSPVSALSSICCCNAMRTKKIITKIMNNSWLSTDTYSASFFSSYSDLSEEAYFKKPLHSNKAKSSSSAAVLWQSDHPRASYSQFVHMNEPSAAV